MRNNFEIMIDFLEYRFTDLSLILSIIAGGLLVFQLIYYIIVYGRVAFYKGNKNKTNTDDIVPNIGVSIVIVTQNDEQNLQDKLMKILEQDYDKFEVVIVNENSTDDSEFILHILQENYNNLKVVNLQENINKFSSRKFAISIGIKSAKYDNIILTDSYCMPNSFSWLKNMIAPFADNKKKIVVGFCGIEAKKGSLNQFVQYDNATAFINCFSFSVLGNPFMARETNVAYNKKFFFQKGGFINQYKLVCGEDEKFVNKYANKKNTSIVLNKDSFMYVPNYSSYSSFRRNKFTHYLSFKHYKLKDKFLLNMLPFSTFLFYLSLAFLVIIQFPWQYCVASLVIKWICQILYYKSCMKKLEIKKCYLLVPFMEIYFIFLTFNLWVKSLFAKKVKWD